MKRTGSVKRSLQRVMPTIFQPTLPVTTRYQGLMHLYPPTLCSSITWQPVLCFVQTSADADQLLHVTSCSLIPWPVVQWPVVLLYKCTMCYIWCILRHSAISIGQVFCTAHEAVIALFSYHLNWCAGMSRAERLGLLLLSQLGAEDDGSRYVQYAICFCC